MLNIHGILDENKLTTDTRVYFWALTSIDLYVLMPVSHCLDYSSFVISFETGKSESSNFVLFKDCFGYFEFLQTPNER